MVVQFPKSDEHDTDGEIGYDDDDSFGPLPPRTINVVDNRSSADAISEMTSSQASPIVIQNPPLGGVVPMVTPDSMLSSTMVMDSTPVATMVTNGTGPAAVAVIHTSSSATERRATPWKNYVIVALVSALATICFLLLSGGVPPPPPTATPTDTARSNSTSKPASAASTSSCFAQTPEAQDLCKHLNSVSFASDQMHFPLVPSRDPSPDEKALEWIIRQQNSSSEYSTERLVQRFALVSLFFHNIRQTTSDSSEADSFFCGGFWEEWALDAMESTDECDWFGEDVVECSDDGIVIGLRSGWDSTIGFKGTDFLSLRCFVGALPPNLALLSNLKVLSLNGQDFQQSTIPQSFYTLGLLEVLALGSSSIGGSISPMLNMLTNLKVLDISRNLISGQIPEQLWSLTNIAEFRLDHNSLNGTIPASIMSFDTAEKLLLHENKLDGSIPTIVGQMTNLRRLELQGNQLTGQIPLALGTLVNLIVFHAFNNRMRDEDVSHLCPTDRTFDSLSLNIDPSHCLCCTSFCLPDTIGESMCSTAICDHCNGQYPFVCRPIDNVDEGWRKRAMSCSCPCQSQ